MKIGPQVVVVIVVQVVIVVVVQVVVVAWLGPATVSNVHTL